jgi:hypothetical protein
MARASRLPGHGRACACSVRPPKNPTYAWCGLIAPLGAPRTLQAQIPHYDSESQQKYRWYTQRGRDSRADRRCLRLTHLELLLFAGGSVQMLYVEAPPAPSLYAAVSAGWEEASGTTAQDVRCNNATFREEKSHPTKNGGGEPVERAAGSEEKRRTNDTKVRASRKLHSGRWHLLEGAKSEKPGLLGHRGAPGLLGYVGVRPSTPPAMQLT